MKPGLADQAANRKGARRRRFWSSDEKRRMVAEKAYVLRDFPMISEFSKKSEDIS